MPILMPREVISGGPVFNDDTGVVEGVLVRGPAALQYVSRGNCFNEMEYPSD